MDKTVKNILINLILKEKVQKYCEIDCISLHQVLLKFRDLVFSKWGLITDKYPIFLHYHLLYLDLNLWKLILFH